MGDLIVNRSAEVSPPIADSGTDPVYGTARLAITGSSARFLIPAKWKNRWVTFVARGADAQVSFGGSAVAVTYDQASSVASELITLNAASGLDVPQDTPTPFFVPGSADITHFAAAGSGAGLLVASVSSNPTPGSKG